MNFSPKTGIINAYSLNNVKRAQAECLKEKNKMPSRISTAVLILSAAIFASATPANAFAKKQGDGKSKAIELFSAGPAVFIENTGQIENQSVRYVFYGSGVTIFHTTDGPVFGLFRKEADADNIKKGGNSAGCSYEFAVRFIGAKFIEPAGAQSQQTKVNYYIGNDSRMWQQGAATCAEVVYPELYEGIDLHTFGKHSHLKYEFRVSPGADYSQIKIRCEGINRLWVDGGGDLHIETPTGELIDDKPYIYQVIDGRCTKIKGRYRLIDETSYSFDISGAIDGSSELVIDPDLAWASYLGASNYDYGYGIAVDSANNCLITGLTYSTDFPVPGGFDKSYNGGSDVFVAKITGSGQLSWASYLGGNNDDWGNDIAVDDENNILITGGTSSTNFPVTGGFDTNHNGYDDVFVAKVRKNGQLAWASYLGGSGYDEGYGIAVDDACNCLITGRTTSNNFPVPGGFDTGLNGTYDAFVAKVTSGCLLSWASYLGGSNNDWGNDIAVNSAGNCFITGDTNSTNFPVTAGKFDTSFNGEYDAFVAKVTGGCLLSWASYLGGNNNDYGYGIALDNASKCLITGSTDSTNFPRPGGFDTSYNGGGDVFVAKMTADGNQLSWASYLGGSDSDAGNGITADSNGNCLITGKTSSTDFPAPRGFDTSHNGGKDAFVAKVTGSGQLAWASYLGGNGHDEGYGIAVDNDGNCLITGYTGSTDFPVPDGFDTSYNGQRDVFVAKVNPSALGTGDFNRDGFVNFDDFVQLAAFWLASCSSPDWCGGCDVNGSGKVNFYDFNVIANQWLIY